MISKKIIIFLFGFSIIITSMIFIILYTFTESTKYVSDYQNSVITQSNVDHVFAYCPSIVQYPEMKCIPLHSNSLNHTGECLILRCTSPTPDKTTHDTCPVHHLFCTPLGTSFDVQTINDCAKLYTLIYQHLSTRDLSFPSNIFDPSIAQQILPRMVYDRFCQDSLKEYTDSEINQSIMKIKEIFATEIMKDESILDITS